MSPTSHSGSGRVAKHAVAERLVSNVPSKQQLALAALSGAVVLAEVALAYAEGLWRNFEHFVVADPFQGLLERELAWREELDRDV